MRVISADLTTVQNIRSPRARVTVSVEARGQMPSAPMVEWAQVVSNSAQSVWYPTAAVGLSSGAVLRFVGLAGSIVQDKVTTPGTAAGWAAATRTTVVAGAGATSLAVHRVGTLIRLWYVSNADGNVYYRESSDDGVTWGAATTVYSGGDAYLDLVVGYLSDGVVSNGPWFFGFSTYSAGNYTARFGYYSAGWVTHAYSSGWRAAGIDVHATAATRHRVLVFRQSGIGASRIRALDKLAGVYSAASDIDQTQASLFGLILTWARYSDVGSVTMGVVGERGYQGSAYLGVGGVFDADNEEVADEGIILAGHKSSNSAAYSSLCAVGDDLYVIGDTGVWRGTALAVPTWTLTPVKYVYDDHRMEMELASGPDGEPTGLLPGQVLVVTRTLSWDGKTGSEVVRLVVVAVERRTDGVTVLAADGVGFMGLARCRRPVVVNDGSVYAATALRRLGARVGVPVTVDATSLATAAVMAMTAMPMENLRSGAYRLGSQSEWYLVPANDGSFGVTMITPGVSDSGDYDDTAHVYGVSPKEHPVWRAAEVADWRRLGFAYVLGTYSTDPEDGSVVGMAVGPVVAGTRPQSYSLTNMRYNTQARVEAAATAEAARQAKLPVTATLEANANLALEVLDVVQVTESTLGWSAEQFRVRRIEERWEKGRLWQKLYLGEI